MKKYLAGLVALLLAVSVAAYTKPIQYSNPTFTIYTFKFVGNPSLRNEVEDPSKWIQGLFTCNGVSDLPCRLQTSDFYTHNISLGDGDFIQVLNTPTDTPPGEGYITIQSTNGYLDTSPNPDVQYYAVTTGTGYIYQNQEF